SNSSTRMVYHWLRLTLSLDEPRHLRQRIEILGNELIVSDRNRIPFLKVTHELENSGGVDDTPLLERVVVGKCHRRRVVAEQEVLDYECTNVLNEPFHGLTASKWLMNRSTRSWVERMPTRAMSSFALVAWPRSNLCTSAATASGRKTPSRFT